MKSSMSMNGNRRCNLVVAYSCVAIAEEILQESNRRPSRTSTWAKSDRRCSRHSTKLLAGPHMWRRISKSSLKTSIPNPFGLLCFLRQTIRYETERAAEERLSLHSYIVGSNSRVPTPASHQQARLLRTLQEATRIRDPVKTGIEDFLIEFEHQIANELRRPSESDVTTRVRHIIWPIAALIVV